MNATERTRRVPWFRNLLVWAALMALLFLSLAAAYAAAPRLATALGLLIACAKAGLVAGLYMELDRAHALVRLAAFAGAVFATVLFALTFSDVLTRP